MSDSEEHDFTTLKLSERPTEAAHTLVRERVNPGDRVIDATIGNGYDTVFLADLVGPSGHVDGFDIQNEAIESARFKLHERHNDNFTLHQIGHEKMADLIVAPVQSVMFNLGYLPGGDKDVTTQPTTTTEALQAAVDILSPTGIVTILIYTGHPGGREEADAVRSFCCALNDNQFTTTLHKSPSDNPAAPFLITITRK